jgi:hypothetical protein
VVFAVRIAALDGVFYEFLNLSHDVALSYLISGIPESLIKIVGAKVMLLA